MYIIQKKYSKLVDYNFFKFTLLHCITCVHVSTIISTYSETHDCYFLLHLIVKVRIVFIKVYMYVEFCPIKVFCMT